MISVLLNQFELLDRKKTTKLIKLAPVLSLILSLFCSIFFLSLFDKSVFDIIISFFNNTFGSTYMIAEVFVVFTPLCFCSLGITIAKKVGFWNIGGEGQLLMGALGGCLTSMYFNLPNYWGIALAILISFFFGGLITAIISILKIYRHSDEVLLTLLSNFIILHFIGYLISGPMRDSETNWIQSKTIPLIFQIERIPSFGRVSYSIIILFVLILILIYLERYTYIDIFFRMVKDLKENLELQNISITKYIVSATFISGGLCGLAGWLEVASIQHRLIDNISSGYGYYGILIAVLSDSKIFNTILNSLFCALILSGLDGMSRELSLPIYINNFIFGLSLLIYIIILQLSKNKILFRKL